jgi:hypothetical protein
MGLFDFLLLLIFSSSFFLFTVQFAACCLNPRLLLVTEADIERREEDRKQERRQRIEDQVRRNCLFYSSHTHSSPAGMQEDTSDCRFHEAHCSQTLRKGPDEWV